MKRSTHIYFVFFFFIAFNANAQRSEIDFNKGWKFYLGNDSTAINNNFNDANWRTLNLPHDWSIEASFSETAPATTQGGALPGGVAWYRKAFTVPASSKNKNVFIEFDGVYRNSELWINGHYLGKRPNGYISFQYELTPYLKYGMEENVIAVKVDNSQQPNSRWYTGSGIYRNVRLISVSPYASVKQWRAFVTTSEVTKAEARVNVVTNVISTVKGWKSVSLFFDIYDDKGQLVSGGEEKTGAGLRFSGNTFQHSFSTNIFNPKLWSVSNPNLYRLVVRVVGSGKLIDSYETTFGIRFFHFDSEKGFFLNNQPLKIKGVCMHHDLGVLGAAFNYRAAERQLQILKDMGCNAIRTAHNPPAPEFLDLCDKMGFLVMDEAFDMWQKKKNKFDYYLDFKEWHERDLRDLVLRDRNHPSIFMWSIGNEIREQFDSSGTTITKELVDIVKKLDPTRPVTAALTETIPEKNFITKANALDVLGFNYKYYDYPALPERFPGQKFIASETASALATRGVYEFPSDSIRIWPPDYKAQDTFAGNKDYTASAYDNTYAYWGGTHEKTWQAVKKYPHMAGIFVWSGFDFLGEPLPYPKFPARSSYYGIIDLAGFPKDVYYMYKSEWSSKPVLHIFPAWNAESFGNGVQTGDSVDVWAYYNNADEVELFLNGKSVGLRRKHIDEVHVMWRLSFQPGSLKAISRKNGKIVLVKELRTAGKPFRVELITDRKMLTANGRDLSFVTVRVLDKNGIPVPYASNLLKFTISGEGIIAGTDNGYQADTVSLKSKERKAWKGMALVIVQSTGKKGNITLRADSAGLLPAILSLKTSD